MTRIRRFVRTHAALLAASVAAGAIATPAFAQADDSAFDSSDAIVVVARKREEKIIDVPIAVTAMSQDQLEDMGAN
ncbi:MAG: hypothetical protein KDE55_17445, partial [Novosphingobium sp.]|nr:hypothetical protein [Novosphingobium sp.]